MAQTKDFYAALGVGEKATPEEIKKQYRRLAKQYHPDANNSDPKAADRFKEISEAYTVLSDAEKRRQYDDMRRLGAFGGFGGGRPGGARPGGAGAQGNVRFEDFDVGGIGGFGDIFSSMFGSGAGGRAGAPGARPRGPEQGQSVESTLTIPFLTAATGGKVPIELEVNEECGTCHGTGAAPGASVRTCPECAGRGTISFGQGGFAVNRPCPMCLGRGNVPTERCPTCTGSGEVRSRKRVLITVPPGVDTGSKIRLKGQGGKGINGGPAGDLLITFEVEPDPEWSRDGIDVIRTVPLNVAQATLGTRITVRTLDDKQVALRVPPGTHSGKRFRIRNQGIHKGGQRGDMIVEIAIRVPDQLNEKQEQAMKEFAAAGGLEY